MQLCRIEGINVEGLIEGSVVHFHWVRSVEIQYLGTISASGLGMLLFLVGLGRCFPLVILTMLDLLFVCLLFYV